MRCRRTWSKPCSELTIHASLELIARTRAAVQELLSGMSAWLLDLTAMKVGRTTFVVAYLNPAMPVDGPWLDRLRERIDQRCSELLGPVRTEVIVTGQAPFAA